MIPDRGSPWCWRWAWLVGSLLVAAAALAGYPQPAVLLGWLGLALVVPASCGAVVRALLGGAALMALWVAAAVAFSVLDAPLAPRWLAAGTVLTSTAVAAIWGQWRHVGRHGDGALTACVLLGTALVIASAPHDPVGRLLQLGTAPDNGYHFRYLAAMVQARGFTWAHPVPGLLPEASLYAQGEAFLSGYIGWLAGGAPAHPTAAELVSYAYLVWPLKVVLLGAAAAAASREVVDRVAPARQSASVWAVATSFVLVGAGVGPMLGVLGFQTQILGLAALVLGLLALTAFPAHLSASACLVLTCPAMVLICHSWVPIAPALAAPLVVFVWQERAALARWSLALAGMAALVASAGAVVRVMRLDSRGAASVSTTGWVVPVPPVTLTLLGALVCLTVYSLRGRLEVTGGLRTLLLALGGGLITSVGFGVFLHVQTGHLSYYFQKTVYTCAVVAMVLASVGVGVAAVSAPRRGVPLVLAAWVAAPILAWAPMAPVVVPHLLHRDLPGVSAPALEHALPVRSEHQGDTVVLNGCDELVDYSSRWTGTLGRTWSQARDDYLAADAHLPKTGGLEQRAELLHNYAAAVAPTAVTVFVPAQCAPGWAERVKRIPGVTVIQMPRSRLTGSL